MSELARYTKVHFHRFKAFDSFVLNLRSFNILVGPNNAGKSTILAAFRILAAALRRANSRKPEVIMGPRGSVYGHAIDLRNISVAEENLFFNYDSSEPAYVTFTLDNRNELQLYFPEQGTCFLIPNAHGKKVLSPATFKSQFNCSIGFVPILGPVDHHEYLYDIEAARLALFNYRAARNFRNIWYHYPESFDEFREILRTTWPGMDIEKPIIERGDPRTVLRMFCPEERIPREIFWAGFGFQVWCQMLTHLIQSKSTSIFLIDEPDIYLHSDLQRQLLTLLRGLGPDILIATHSVEIITEAETNDIVLINKKRHNAKRIKDPRQLDEVFRALGSNLNPILTQLAKTRRALFLEGKDFQIIGRFAGKLGETRIGGRAEFAVIPVEGFNPERIRSLKLGMETTLGTKVVAAAVFDKDYRSNEECDEIRNGCSDFCAIVKTLECKEIENYLLVPSAIDRAARGRLAEKNKRTGEASTYEDCAVEILEKFASEKRGFIFSRYLSDRRRFLRKKGSAASDATIDETTLKEFEAMWGHSADSRFKLIPGKDALSVLNQSLQQKYQINITPTSIVDAMTKAEVPLGIQQLIKEIGVFAALKPPDA